MHNPANGQWADIGFQGFELIGSTGPVYVASHRQFGTPAGWHGSWIAGDSTREVKGPWKPAKEYKPRWWGRETFRAGDVAFTVIEGPLEGVSFEVTKC
jgi:hypothetical protein